MKAYFLFFVLLGFWSCQISPDPISYGRDMCHHCKMTIVDQRYGAELVTTKGKIKKFDAVECMIDYLSSEDITEYAMVLVNTYDQPTDLLNADECRYLISENMPSPMGAFLNAFASSEHLEKAQESNGGEAYSWSEISNNLENLRINPNSDD